MTDNVELVRQAIQVLNSRQMHRIPEFIAPDMQRHDLVGAYPDVAGSTGVADFLGELLRGAPDLRLEIQDIFGAGDRVTMRFKVEGTHEGLLWGSPGTGRRFSANAINIYRIADGKLAETWQLLDLAGFLKQVQG